MNLRDYQLDAIERVRQAMIAGRRRVLLVMPTGAGKTVTCGEIVRRTVERGRRSLWLAHRAELIDQSAETLTRMGLTVGALCATASTPPNPFAPVQVASVQTLLARNVRPAADLIVADEAHHYASAAPEYMGVLQSYPNALVVGPTATPERGDGGGLKELFDAIVVGATVRQLTDAGHLVPCEVLRPDKPLAPGELARNPVDAYVEHASGRRAIVFARSVSLAEEYAQEFEMRGIEARAITNETPWAERRLWIDDFGRGSVHVLTCVYTLTEGFDSPVASCCIVARGCGSAGMWIQMIGRVLRPAAGKRDAIVLDLRGVSHEHGLPDADRAYSLEGKGIRLRDSNSYCPVCGAPRTPPDACESCGYEPSGEDGAKPDHITGDRLVPYAHKRQEGDEERFATLLRWMRIAKAKNYKTGWIYAKWKAVYAVGLSSADVCRAEAMIDAERRGPVAA